MNGFNLVGFQMANHYSIKQIKDCLEPGETEVDFLRRFFPEGRADEMNWLFTGTSGVHGYYTTAGDLIRDSEEQTDGEPHELWDKNGKAGLTVLIVQARLVTMYYGTIEVGMDDIRFIEGIGKSTKSIITNREV